MYFKNWRLKVILLFHYMVTVYVCNRALLVFFKSRIAPSSNSPDHQDEERNTYKLPCTSGEIFF